MMDEEFAGSGEEEMSSPHDYALASPNDMHDIQDMQDMHDMDDMHDLQEMDEMHEIHHMHDTDEREQSQSPTSQDVNSDIEVDV